MTPTSALQPPPNPARIQFCDPKTGMLTQIGYWFLYNLFTGAQNAEFIALLAAFDSTSEGGSDASAAVQAAMGDSPQIDPGIAEAKLLASMNDGCALWPPDALLALLMSDAPGVQNLNGIVGAIKLLAGAGISLTLGDHSITVAASGGTGVLAGNVRYVGTVTFNFLSTDLGVISSFAGASAGTLVKASTVPGQFLFIRNENTGALSVIPNGTNTIDGGGTRLLQSLEGLILQSDGISNWTRVGSYNQNVGGDVNGILSAIALNNIVAGHTITLAALTGGGTTGSITWNAKGLITAYTDPT